MPILPDESHRRQADIAELRRRCPIADVWAALGGELRGKRGRAFWRGGKNLSVSVDVERGLWHDFVTGDGGDVIGLVEKVLGGDFADAVRWMADFAGVSATTFGATHQGSADPSWHADLANARGWALAARALAEDSLEIASLADPAKLPLTRLLGVLRVRWRKRGDEWEQEFEKGDTAVAEYRDWRSREPRLTAGMVEAGRRSEERLYDRIAIFIVQELLDGEARCGEDTGTCGENS